MMPEKLAIILDICSDLYGKGVRDDDKLSRVVEKELWEGFTHDIRAEFDLPDNFQIDPSWKVYELYGEITNVGMEEDVLPEMSMVLHLDDEVPSSLVDDLEDILEKYDIPFAMVGYTFKNGEMKRSVSRSSDEDIFDYHDNVIKKFQK